MSDSTNNDHQRAAEPLDTPPAESESTVGTGTGIALGCIALTIILTLLGILFLLALRWLG